MEKLYYNDLLKQKNISKLIVESYDQCLYQCFWVDGDREKLIWWENNKPMATFSLTEMRKKLFALNPAEVFLRQKSAYDEMVGQPVGSGNTMLVPLAIDSVCF